MDNCCDSSYEPCSSRALFLGATAAVPDAQSDNSANVTKSMNRNSFFLDLLAGPLASTLERVVLPDYYAAIRDPMLEDGMEYDAVVAMCERVGIEVYLADS